MCDGIVSIIQLRHTFQLMIWGLCVQTRPDMVLFGLAELDPSLTQDPRLELVRPEILTFDLTLIHH